MKVKVADKDKQKIRKLKRELKLVEAALIEMAGECYGFQEQLAEAEQWCRWTEFYWIFIAGMLTVWLAYGLGRFL